MHFLKFVICLLAPIVVATPAFASFGAGDKPAPSSTQSTSIDAVSSSATARQEAERWYGDAYNDVAKAKAELAAGKADRAEKRFRKALERGTRAVEIDSTYHEAWNLVGYSARKLKDYDKALASYERCLAIKSDFAPAREYLGEAYLELNQPEKAREQLTHLEEEGAEPERALLQAAFDDYMKAHPSTPAPEKTGAVAPAASDSATTAQKREKP